MRQFGWGTAALKRDLTKQANATSDFTRLCSCKGQGPRVLQSDVLNIHASRAETSYTFDQE